MMPSTPDSGRRNAAAPFRQRGVTLVVVLVLLLVVTMIALISLRGTLMEERMSANVLDRSLAFQSAEAALRAGESAAFDKPKLPASGCSKGVCAKPNPADAPVWDNEAVWADAPFTTVKLGSKSDTPRYIVELLADDVPPKGSCTTSGDVSESTCSGVERRYRVTARSQGEGRATVMLQSIYAVP